MTKHAKPSSANSFLEKIVVNVGVGRLRQQANFDDRILPDIIKEVAAITGQKPANRAARKSIAGFKVRENEIVGLQVTLRGARMENFLKLTVAAAFPRVKDFRGVEVSQVDENGNLNVGFKDQYVFPEINPEKSRVPFGFQVTLVPRVKNREAAIDFYRSFGVPLKSL
jgi:large subunit ribosomal protein L5